MKRHKSKIISLLAVFVLSISFACASTALFASAATYSQNNIFSSSGASANTEQGYVAYNLNDGANIYYRKNLALKWYESDGNATYFSTVFSFGDGESYNFDSFTMTMETEPFSSSKENKSTNTLEFTVGGDGDLDVSVNGDTAVDFEKVTVTEGEGDSAKTVETITVAFTDDADGVFNVSVNGKDVGEFKNIGMNYARYASSTADTPITPLTFSAELPEAAEGEDAPSQLFVIRELNGQSLAFAEGTTTVDDTEAPVLVVNSEIKQFIMGSQLDFDYIAIDVLDSSVSTTRYYYAYDAAGTRVELDPEEGETTYEEMDSSKRFFENDFATLSNGTGYLSVAFRLSDGSNDYCYYIEWFADENSVQDMGGYGYIPVVVPSSVSADNARPSYTFNDQTTGAGDLTDYELAVKAASKQEDGTSIQVGTGAYYYIPSLKPYITDPTCGYTDMTFDLYWRTSGGDTQSSTGLSYDELRIELTAEGAYEFRIVPVNRLGYTLEMHDDKGSLVTSVSTDNIWTIQELENFGFTVEYKGVFIEEPEETDDGYIDVTYTFDSFEIISLSDSYSSPVTEYKLYYLDLNDAYAGRTIALSELKASLLAMDENGVCTYGTWIEIPEPEDGEEDDNEYAQSWSASSLSFIPQRAGYFGVLVTSYDDGRNLPVAEQASVASISLRADSVPGDTYWLRNNVLSVVFICVGAACLIGIIVLLLVKPKDKKAAAQSNSQDPSSGSDADATADGKEDLKTRRKNRK